MQNRLPVVLSTTALLVAVFGATPLGHAASRAIHAVPPFAKTASFAKFAGNASKLNGRKSTLSGAPGTIPVVGRNGKLPASIGAVGLQGPQGLKGPTGPTGPAGLEGEKGESGPGVLYSKVYAKQSQVVVAGGTYAIAKVDCNPGDLPVYSNENLGGGGNVDLITEGADINPANIGSSTLVAGSYSIEVKNNNALNIVLTANVYCAPVKT
jgi:hypothetical protein